MAVSLVGTPTTAGGSTTISKPTGTANGDLLVLFMASHGATTAPTLPSGWSSATTNANAGAWSTAAAYLVAGASEPSSYTWTAGTGSDWNTATLIRCQGQDSTTQIDGTSKTSGTSGTLTLAAITASVAGDALLTYSADWTDIGVSTWPLSGSIYVDDLATNDQQTGKATGLASGSTGSMSVVYNAGSGGSLNVLAVLVKSAAGGGGTAWSKALTDAQSALDTRFSQAQKRPSEFLSALDTLVKAPTSSQSEKFSSLDSPSNQLTHRLTGDTTSATDSTQRARGSVWSIVDAFSSRDSITQHALSKFLVETLSSLDTTRFATTHSLAETLVLVDVLSKLPSHLLSDILSAQDVRLASALKTLQDTQSAQDTRTALVIKTLAEQLVLVDSTSWQTVHRIVDNLSATDKLTAGRGLLLALQEWFSSRDVPNTVKQQALANGLLGVLSLTISLLLGVHLAISTSASLGAVLGAITQALHATLTKANTLQSQSTLSSSLRATLALG